MSGQDLAQVSKKGNFPLSRPKKCLNFLVYLLYSSMLNTHKLNLNLRLRNLFQPNFVKFFARTSTQTSTRPQVFVRTAPRLSSFSPSFLSSQDLGFRGKKSNFCPARGLGSKGIFRGPAEALPSSLGDSVGSPVSDGASTQIGDAAAVTPVLHTSPHAATDASTDVPTYPPAHSETRSQFKTRL